jgi:hypothetical protein
MPRTAGVLNIQWFLCVVCVQTGMGRIQRALKRARYAAAGAAVGAALGGLFSRSAASTGGATGALVGAFIAEARFSDGEKGTVDRLKERADKQLSDSD